MWDEPLELSSSAGARGLCSPCRAHGSSDVCQLAVWILELFLSPLCKTLPNFRREEPLNQVFFSERQVNMVLPPFRRGGGRALRGDDLLRVAQDVCSRAGTGANSLNCQQGLYLYPPDHPSFLYTEELKQFWKEKKKKREGLHLQSFLTFHWQGFSFPPSAPPCPFFCLSVEVIGSISEGSDVRRPGCSRNSYFHMIWTGSYILWHIHCCNLNRPGSLDWRPFIRVSSWRGIHLLMAFWEQQHP